MIAWSAWRLHRRGLIGFSVGGFLISFFYGAAFQQAAGTSASSQAAFGRSISLVAKQFAFLIPLPVHPETLGGYEQYKWLSGAIVVMMLWAGLAGVGIGRGDEDRGLTAEWIASGVSRTRLLLARSAAFGLVLLIACIASVLGIVAIAPAVHQDPNVAGEILKALSMAAGLFAGYAIALLISQVPAERQTATALGVGAWCCCSWSTGSRIRSIRLPGSESSPPSTGWNGRARPHPAAPSTSARQSAWLWPRRH